MKFVKASLCLSVALAITACSEPASVETHLKSAKSYLSENKTNESIIELKNAIRVDSKNAEARFLLGQIYLNLGEGAAAAKELERAHQFNYTANKVLPLLARAYLLTESDADVLALSDISISLANAERSHYLAYKTLAALRSEQPELAKESVELAQTLGEQNLYSMLALAYLQFSENNYDEVEALLSRILTIDDQQVDALMLQGQLSMVTKNFEQAAQSFKTFLHLQPRSGVAQLLLANALLKSGQYDEADKYADNILAKINNQPFAHYIKAMVAFNRKTFDKASEHAEAALSSNFNQFNLKLVAGASAFYLKNWERSHYHLSAVVEYLPKDHQARRMLAVTQLELGLIDEISTTISEFDSGEMEGSKFLASMSYKLLELGAMDEAKKVLAISEGATAGDNARQGILKLMMNDPSGIQNLEEAMALDPEFIEAELALAYAALQNNDIDKARAIAQKWQETYPDKPGGYNLMASVYIKEEKYNQAETTLQKSLALEPNNIFALTEQLRLARQQENEALSQQRADNLITLAPYNNQVLRHYFGVYHNQKGLDKLQQAYQTNKAEMDKALLVAEAMVSLDQYKEAENLLSSLSSTANLPKKYWQLTLFTYKKQNEIAKVQLTLENWLAASPYHVEPVILLADLHASHGNNSRALSVVKRGLDYHTGNLVLQLIQMQILLNSQQVKEAKVLYEDLAKNNINDALKQGFLGRIFLLESKHAQAIPKLTALYEVYSSAQNAMYLASAYLGAEQDAKAIETLDNYLTIDPNNNRIKTMLAGIYLEDDSNKAITVYENLVKNEPKNVIAHNNLAWLYLEQEKIDLALQHARKANNLAPDIANIADTYAKVLLKSGDNEQALKYAGKASELAKGQDIAIQLNYIEVLIANSKNAEASRLLNALTPENSEQTKIKSQLQEKI
ncbi:XrtA/PEP-CTERM system TPR-repeat protein PrsT [Colwellia sp. E2M01]|uniref:XrtA/PEP-CTERM system TPR-repeat protein PrsT n=1 Tax=Colwellia sp. E2M01 TaxID=2841561 RepID=UPI001C08F2A4|nr:XrtA/PEP-CTERM system TPR-repeat protein PrsT [Colwellia sp. E2M01]MBU2871214.1 PEP-CTERM system TPR-repeat protein PrsT [Colwellia sp. E2M01]